MTRFTVNQKPATLPEARLELEKVQGTIVKLEDDLSAEQTKSAGLQAKADKCDQAESDLTAEQAKSIDLQSKLTAAELRATTAETEAKDAKAKVQGAEAKAKEAEASSTVKAADILAANQMAPVVVKGEQTKKADEEALTGRARAAKAFNSQFAGAATTRN